MNPIEQIIQMLMGRGLDRGAGIPNPRGGPLAAQLAGGQPPVLGARGPGRTAINPAGLRRGAPGANPDIMAIIKSLMGQPPALAAGPSASTPIRPGGMDPAAMQSMTAAPPVLPSGPPASTPIRPGGLDPSKMAGATSGVQGVIDALMAKVMGGTSPTPRGMPMAEQQAARAAAQPPIPPFNIEKLLSDLGLGAGGPGGEFQRGAAGGPVEPDAGGGDPLSDFMRGLGAAESGSEENPYEEPGEEVVVTPDRPDVGPGVIPGGIGDFIRSLFGGGTAAAPAGDLDVEVVDVDPGSVKHSNVEGPEKARSIRQGMSAREFPEEESGAYPGLETVGEGRPGGEPRPGFPGMMPTKPDEAEEAVAAELKGKGDAEVPVETPEETAEGVAETAMSSGGPRQSYVIKRGDTLWDIAEKIYGDGRMYKQVARMNGITNPNMIIAGKELVLPEEGIPKPRRRPAHAGV